ncbi:MAG: carboxypeptidase regulatory-like domain-containing protein [Prevotellaceae bacterium]|jgi:hypothetical protein|nr:carboxypeptidase regulatory-like domain-containing protein [Prevotellaceae bacterium]
MKKIIFLAFAAVIFCGCENPQIETTGGIYGIVVDKATGEPIKSAGVELQPSGTIAVTGSEGQFEFTEVKSGDYSLHVTKTGYSELVGYKTKVEGGKTTKVDIQLEKLPSALKIINDKGLEIDSLNFGTETSVVTRSFSIFNDSPETLEWLITENCDWITELSKTTGTLQATKQTPVSLTINRALLAGGENTYILNITSDNGNKELIITATGENRTLPTLNTMEATNITSSSAIFHGEITAAGLPAYDERGFVYSLSEMPTVENTIQKLTSPVNSTTAFLANASGLSIDQTYYVRAYAKNALGYAYSTNQYSFQTIVGMPQISTQEATNKNIANGTITFNGTIVAVGDPAYTERGFCYGIAHNPTVDDEKYAVSGSGTGAFSKNVTNLQEGHTYYVRAYATNIRGTVYGTEVIVDFNAVMPVVQTNAVSNKNIGAGTATVNGNVVSIGDLPYTERGFVYAQTSNPTINDTKKVVSGTGTGSYSGNITNLAANTVYYVRAYVTNSRGTTYGDNVVLDFSAINPQVTTQAVSDINIGAGTAVFYGTIVNVGDPAYTEKGFAYGTMPTPTIDDTKKIVSGTSAGAFTANINNLPLDQQLYVRAYAKNSLENVIYGSVESFALTSSLPSVTTQSVTADNRTAGTATFNGTIVNVGNPAYTEKGFVYAIGSVPTIDDTKLTVSGSGTGTFSKNATNLVMGNTYRIRAYAKNSINTAYGEEITLNFNAVQPQVTTLDATNANVGNGTVTLNGNIANIGDPVCTEKGFVYSTSTNPDVTDVSDTKVIVAGNAQGNFTANITNLPPSNTYYVRAYVKDYLNVVGYGAEKTFNFAGNTPLFNSTDYVVFSNTNRVEGTATFSTYTGIYSAGTPAYTERGFVYSTTAQNPTIENTKIVVSGSGSTGNFTTNVTNLVMGQTYYVRAYATNAVGTVYNQSRTLDFNAISPSSTMSAATNITENTAMLNSSITNTGDPAYTERGFVYGTVQNPTNTDTKQTVSGSGAGNFSANISGLSPGTTYYVRSYTVAQSQYYYSSQNNFTTKMTISGTVKNSSTQEVISGASVVVKSGATTIGSTTTNSSGNFSISNVAAGSYSVNVTASGYANYSQTFSFSASQSSVNVLMSQLGSLTGTLKDNEGYALPNVQVKLGSSLTATTSTTGAFTFNNVPAQSYTITVTKSNYANISQQITIASGANSVNLVMSIVNPIVITSGSSWFIFDTPSLEGTTTTQTIYFQNVRQQSLSWSLTNRPSYGITFSPTSGTVAAGATVGITMTFTYPKEPSMGNQSGRVRLLLADYITGFDPQYPYVYVWNWTNKGVEIDPYGYFYSFCSQNVNLAVGTNNLTVSVGMESYIVWDN